MYFAKYKFRFFLSWLIAIKVAVLSTFVANFTMSRLHVLSGKFLHGKSCCPKSFRFFWLWAFIIDAINQFRTEVIIHQRRQQIKTLPSALTKKKTSVGQITITGSYTNPDQNSASKSQSNSIIKTSTDFNFKTWQILNKNWA